MTRVLTWIITLLAIASANPVRSQQYPLPVWLSDDLKVHSEPVLQRLDVSVDVLGDWSLTRYRMDFRMEMDFQGTFFFPIPPSGDVIGLEGKQQGEEGWKPLVKRHRSEDNMDHSIVRRMGPGVLAATGKRVLSWNGVKGKKGLWRIEIDLLEPLVNTGDALSGSIALPFTQVADSFRLRCIVHRQRIQPRSTPHPLGKVQFKQIKADYGFIAQKLFFRPNQDLHYSLPLDFESARILPGLSADTAHFLVQIVQEPEAIRDVRRVLLRWDASASRNRSDHAPEFMALDRYFSSFRSLDVHLQVLGGISDSLEMFRVDFGRWKKLRSRLENVTYDGLAIPKDIPANTYDQVLTFSDHPEVWKEKRGEYFFWNSSDLPANEKEIDKRIEAWTRQKSRVEKAEVRGESWGRAEIKVGEKFLGSTTWAVHSAGEAMELELRTDGKGIQRWKLRIKKHAGQSMDRQVDKVVGAQPIPEWSPEERRQILAEENVRDEEKMREELAEVFEEMGLWYAGKFNPKDQLPEAESGSLPKLPEAVREEIPSQAVVQMPSLWLIGDSIARDGLPDSLLRQVSQVNWLVGGRLRAWLGEEARQGIWQLVVPGIPTLAPEVLFEVPEWQPNPRYREGLEFADAGTTWKHYLERRDNYALNPSFFIDFADELLLKGETRCAASALSNLIEFGYEEPEILRAAAHRLEAWGHPEMALVFFRKVARLRPGDPIALRDLALALEYNGRQGSHELLIRALRSDPRWFARRYPGLQTVLLREINHFPGLYDSLLPPKIFRPMPLDMRITLDWNRSDTDLDLVVTNPKGQRCDYDHPVTEEGGHLSGDITDGFGPEEFILKEALPGEYTIEVEYEDDPERRISGPTFLKVTIWTDYGRPGEYRQVIPLRLEKEEGKVLIGSIRLN